MKPPPENILYDPTQNRLCIADFGIAHFEEELLATAVATKAADRLANFQYSAPEQREKGVAVDKRADIYALGLILNEMVTGVVPQGTGYKTIAAVAPDLAYLDVIVERMQQQSPGARYAHIEEIKKELIGRKNEFISLQQLDARRRDVISIRSPGKIAPVKLIGFDWIDGELVLKLDRAPEQGWVQRFQNPRDGFGAVMGAGPEMFRFYGDTTKIKVDANVAQQIINYFKGYLEMATRGFQQDVDTQAHKNEMEERRALEQEIEAADERARLLKTLQI